jgi:hypothetical protein
MERGVLNTNNIGLKRKIKRTPLTVGLLEWNLL